MSNNVIIADSMSQEFVRDSEIIGVQTESFLKKVYPSYLVNQDDLESLLDKYSNFQLESISFFRIFSCTTDALDTAFETINQKMEKLLTALHSINTPIVYGLISRHGVTNLVFGIYSSKDIESVITITQGMLSGLEMESVAPEFLKDISSNQYYGILSGVPSLYHREQKQNFSLAPIMNSLNGQDYILLFIAKPVSKNKVSQDISELIAIKDQAFAVSKRNVSRSHSVSNTTSETNTKTEGKNSIAGGVGAGSGALVGAAIGSLINPGAGTLIGASLGGALGTVIGSGVGGGKNQSKSYSKSITEAIIDGNTISGDIQNGFAIELISYVDKALDRLKSGQNNGVWQTTIAFSASSQVSSSIIKACLCGELSKPDPENLGLLSFEPNDINNNELLRIPNFLSEDNDNDLCSYISSDELGLLCTLPVEAVPDFELRITKNYPLIRMLPSVDSINIGKLVDGKRALNNMPFSLSFLDLNKHTFICGITGSGKTTTVKKILKEANKPFLVIESAKKEYRNLIADKTIYTLGKPELNCPQINPFYILPGVSPQIHIDYLKDLFNASFSFYGPMPYILEKCLHSIYINKGWNLTLGYHPMLSNSKSVTSFFDIAYTKKQYALESHKYLFPTMQELKDEITRYVEEELQYDGEIAGNVKTAIKVRLENLCIGAKGFTFNTSEYLDVSKLLEQNVIFELEGLADDSDKAFSVGLLVIFINEYRQVMKEVSGSQKAELKHILVIEEAHRLLKNVNTEGSPETSGNPKGKAVEHFTNMIAEMRSYGQGVIVAEQIPTKLAPDVIKNSSTKIVQRLVSMDDQQVIANTIGISVEDALQLGALESGYAFAHKEGMSLPVAIKISDKCIDDQNNEQYLDAYVSDEVIYNQNLERFLKINMSQTQNAFCNYHIDIKRKIFALLNTLLIDSASKGENACNLVGQDLLRFSRQKGVSWVLCNDKQYIISQYITDIFLKMILRGIYSTNHLPEDSFVGNFKDLLLFPTYDKVLNIKMEFSKLYDRNIEDFALQNVVELIKRSLQPTTDLKSTICEYFIDVDPKTLKKIIGMVKGND